MREVGESSGVAMSMQVEPNQESVVGILTQQETTTTQSTSRVVPTEVRVEQGTKRKTPEDEEDMEATPTKRLETE